MSLAPLDADADRYSTRKDFNKKFIADLSARGKEVMIMRV